MFHSEFGYYGQGVGLATAKLPNGWEDRLVPFEWGNSGEAKAVCLEPHDLVLAKLVAGREKDYAFADALIGRGHVGDLAITRHPTLPFMQRASELRANATPYDAAYIGLAEVLGYALLTADGRLVSAPGPRCEIRVIQD